MKSIFLIILIASACTSKVTNDENPEKIVIKETDTSSIETPSLPPVVNVYIENSGSMKGYFNGYTEFKDALKNYITDIKISKLTDSLNLYVINKTTDRIDSDVNEYLESLSKLSNATTSDIAQIFAQVLSNSSSNTITIFVSDCIFSPEKAKDASEYLHQQQSDIKAAVARHLQHSPTTSITVYKLNSKFTGTYYNRNNQQTSIKGEMRPYYIWLVGDVRQISQLRERVKDSQFKGDGVEHSYTVCPTLDAKANYAILNTPKIGTFELDKDSPKNSIYGIEKGEDEKGKQKFMFSVGFDLGLYETLLSDEYLIDSLSYSLQFNGHPNNTYNLKIAPNTNAGTDYKHTLQLATNSVTTGELSVTLKNTLPKWISETNDSIGLDIRKAMNKTFGIKYLVEGVYEAYTLNGHAKYAEMKLTLKK